HVGSPAEGKVVTHAMMAAGHPPLPSFEVASFSKKLPQHWYDLKDIPYLKTAPKEVQDRYHYADAPFQHTKLALATGVVGLQTYTHMVASRSALNDKGPAKGLSAWPPVWLELEGFGSDTNR